MAKDKARFRKYFYQLGYAILGEFINLIEMKLIRKKNQQFNQKNY